MSQSDVDPAENLPEEEEPNLTTPRRPRPKRLRAKIRELTVAQILAWADAFHARTGRWPTAKSGPVADVLCENWGAISMALHNGSRGLPAGGSLAKLLAEHRNRRNNGALPPLVEESILAWADAYRLRHGRWPSRADGAVAGAPGETWCGIDVALKKGNRGLAGGTTLAQLLAENRGVRNIQNLPELTEEQILRWADEYHAQTGRWPEAKTTDLPPAPGESWRNLSASLQQGKRGLPGGSSLAKLLAANRGRRNPKGLAPLRVADILSWADAFHDREGRYPTDKDGVIPGTGEETWAKVDGALAKGLRGLPGRSSLAQVLHEHRGVRNRKNLPKLAPGQILEWARSFHARNQRWPNEDSGPLDEAPGETWSGINAALMMGLRGLPGGSSLYRLLVAAGLREPLKGHE